MVTKAPVLGVSVTMSTKKQILSHCAAVFSGSSSRSASFPIAIVTPNAEQIVLAQKDPEFRDILNSADIALPDGKPLEWVLRGTAPAIKRISGIDFINDLCDLARKKSGRVFLVGGTDGIARRALTVLQATNPGLDGIAQDGPFIPSIPVPEELIDTLVHTIRGRNIRIVFLGFGAPKQEYLLDALNRRLKGQRVILMVVGGSFDVIGGSVKRAPGFMQSMGLEWLWRLIQEPWRWRRQLALLKFAALACGNPTREVHPGESEARR